MNEKTVLGHSESSCRNDDMIENIITSKNVIPFAMREMNRRKKENFGKEHE